MYKCKTLQTLDSKGMKKESSLNRPSSKISSVDGNEDKVCVL